MRESCLPKPVGRYWHASEVTHGPGEHGGHLVLRGHSRGVVVFVDRGTTMVPMISEGLSAT
jgi:hypothetical protein